jgi:hypothetical protein
MYWMYMTVRTLISTTTLDSAVPVYDIATSSPDPQLHSCTAAHTHRHT